MSASRYAPETRLRSWQTAGPGVVSLDLEGACGELILYEDGTVRLRAKAGSEVSPVVDEAIGRDPVPVSGAEPRTSPGGSGFCIEHNGPLGRARVEVGNAPFRVSVIHGGAEVSSELRGLAFSADGRSRIYVDPQPGERFYGFGEKYGSLDKRGSRLQMRTRDPQLSRRDPLYVAIPFFIGIHSGSESQARGMLLESFAPSVIDVAATHPDRVALETVAAGIDVSLFPGPHPGDVLRRFTNRVGRTPLPPLWALGHHQSRWSYASAREVRRLARKIRAKRFPTDVIHLDIDYMDGFRVFTWHPRRFPDPKQLLTDLAQDGFRVVAIVNPGVKTDPSYATYLSGLQQQVFCHNEDGSPFTLRVWPGKSALPDFNRCDVRQWWGNQHRGLSDVGVAGIWNDMNEPAGWRAALRVPVPRWRDARIRSVPLAVRGQKMSSVVQRDAADEDAEVPHEHVRNLYGQQECRATRDYFATANPERRPFVLTRSGYAGIQRFAAVWTGDNRSRWADLRESVSMLLGLSLSGVAFCGADIGGFAGSCTPELYARWIQLGSFYPLARTHSMWMGRRQEPWRFGARVTAIARSALELRMRLLPYLYGLFRESEANGAPIWRPLFYEFPDDEESAGVEDQVMVGSALLLAPILQKGARERDVYLPPGVWISWRDGARFVGPRTLSVGAPLEECPLFVRGGAVLPTRSPVEHVGRTPTEPCVIEVFPGADGGGELFEDDGESLDYRGGGFASTKFRLWDRAGGRLRLEIARRQGAYRLPDRPLRVVFHSCPAPTAVTRDTSRLEERNDAPGYTYEDGCVHVRVADEEEGMTLEVDPAP